ncbi:MAG: type I restriction-modification system subunit M [Anaeromyxobacter sp.]|nr:type I restriction-modification system subunit M [Anaeromyxobacter sp.]
MPVTPKHRRKALECLGRDRLLELADQAEAAVADRRSKDAAIDALVRSKKVDFGALLAGLSRDELKGICRALDLDDSGKEKAPIVERILSVGEEPLEEIPSSEAEPEEEAPPEPAPAKRGRAKKAAEVSTSGTDLGFENKLFQAADKLRNNMDAAEYKHVVLGLVFLKYISDAFEELHAKLEAQHAEGADPEARDEYTAERVFWVPKVARWDHIQANAKQPSIGQLVDDAMVAVERDNPALKGVLTKNYGRPTLDKQRLGELVDLISTIGLGTKEHRSKDVLGRVYEYFLGQFALAEGRQGGQFYTPRSVVQLLVEMLAPYKGRVYDPCCGSGGMFVQSEKFIEEHGGKVGDLSIYGQESNPTTWRLARMNLAIRSIEANLGAENADTFHRDLHKDLKADYVIANPPFNVSDWGQERIQDDVRWRYGTPPAGNANFGWVQHFIHHLAPTGQAGFVLANGSMSSGQSGEGDIRKALVEADLVDCMVALPGQLFYSTQIPACLWFLSRDKSGGRFRDRRGEVLFIDARKLGRMIDRTQRELGPEDIAKVAGAYHAWRGDKGAAKYEDVAGFCKGASLDEVRGHGHVLTPGRYVGAEDVVDDGEPFEERFPKLLAELEHQFTESASLGASILTTMKRLARGT